jgi:hypothetical protein
MEMSAKTAAWIHHYRNPRDDKPCQHLNHNTSGGSQLALLPIESDISRTSF